MALYKPADIELAVDTLREYDAKCHGSIFYEEWAFLYRFVRHYKPRIILEIGSFYHVSSLAFLTGLSHNKNKGKLISVDINFPRELEFKDKNVKWVKIKSPSNDIVPALSDIDLSFVDGAHGADNVKDDFSNSLNVLSDQGYIIVHDLNYEPTVKGINKVIDINDCSLWTSQPDLFHGMAIYPKIGF